MKQTFAPLAVLALVLAGCLGATESTAPDPMDGYSSPDDPIPVGGEHNHTDPAQHRFARNASLVHFDNLQRFGADAETIVGAHVVDIAGDLLAVGVNAGGGEGGQQGFHLYNIANGTFQHLSFYNVTERIRGDRTLAFSADGNTIFLGYEGANVRPGVAAVDITDRANPKEVAFWNDPQNYGSHTISSGVIDGEQYVFSLAMGVNILRYDASGFTFVGKYLTADQLAALDALQRINPDNPSAGPAQTFALRSLYGHDMTFFGDPVTGKPLLLVAYAYEGLKIVDLTVPSAPLTVGRWMPPADTSHKHYTHSVEAARMPDGQLLIVVGAETFEPANQGIPSPVWILDATASVLAPPLTLDPAHVGTWRNPGSAPAGNLGLSVHFFRIENGILYLSHYHGGVWAVDLRTPAAQSDPQPFGYIMPVPAQPILPPTPCCGGLTSYDVSGVPMVFDVEVKDGRVYAADIIQGVSVIDFVIPAV